MNIIENKEINPAINKYKKNFYINETLNLPKNMNKKQINLFINNVKNLINKFDSYKNLKELEKQKNFYIKHNYSPDLLTTIDSLDNI